MTVAAWLFGAAGVILAGTGVFFIVLRPSLLAEDLEFLGRTLTEIDDFAPQLRRWMRRVFIVLGGHALAAGGLTAFVAATRRPRGSPCCGHCRARLHWRRLNGIHDGRELRPQVRFRWMLQAGTALWAVATTTAVLSF